MAESSRPPTLISGQRPTGVVRAAAPAVEARSLLDLMADGFYMLFLLKNRYTPHSAEEFRNKVREFLVAFERGTAKLQTPAEDLYLAKYAFCALVDETVLTSCERIRDAWERRPLQLELFGEQLAGEGFYDKLEEARRQGAAKIQVMEVFHMCLLVGFQGKYLLEGSEKLGYLTARLGDEIAHLKGKRPTFAPHWEAPDRISHKLRSEVPLWVIASVIALASLLAFLGIRWNLNRQTHADLAKYSQVISLPAQTAHVTITLP